jgi:hypothetical protein
MRKGMTQQSQFVLLSNCDKEIKPDRAIDDELGK